MPLFCCCCRRSNEDEQQEQFALQRAREIELQEKQTLQTHSPSNSPSRSHSHSPQSSPESHPPQHISLDSWQKKHHTTSHQSVTLNSADSVDKPIVTARSLPSTTAHFHRSQHTRTTIHHVSAQPIVITGPAHPLFSKRNEHLADREEDLYPLRNHVHIRVHEEDDDDDDGQVIEEPNMEEDRENHKQQEAQKISAHKPLSSFAASSIASQPLNQSQLATNQTGRVPPLPRSTTNDNHIDDDAMYEHTRLSYLHSLPLSALAWKQLQQTSSTTNPTPRSYYFHALRGETTWKLPPSERWHLAGPSPFLKGLPPHQQRIPADADIAWQEAQGKEGPHFQQIVHWLKEVYDLDLCLYDDRLRDAVFGHKIQALAPCLLHVLFYLHILKHELAYYPPHLLTRIGLQRIILCDTLCFGTQARMAIPVFLAGSLYIDCRIEEAYFLINVLHHEIFHLIDAYMLAVAQTIRFMNVTSSAYQQQSQQQQYSLPTQQSLKKGSSSTASASFSRPHLVQGKITKEDCEDFLHIIHSALCVFSFNEPVSPSNLPSLPSTSISLLLRLAPQCSQPHQLGDYFPPVITELWPTRGGRYHVWLAECSASLSIGQQAKRLDPRWMALNGNSFPGYGQGGATARERNLFLSSSAQTTDQTKGKKQQGFLNGYSLSALEEDKAEVFASLMHSSSSLLSSNAIDSILSSKAQEMAQRMQLFVPEWNKPAFWSSIQNHVIFQDRAKPTEHWEERVNEHGHRYYFNTHTKQTSWIDPKIIV